MSEHLSPEQLSRWMAGERTEEAERHAMQCRDCAASLARFGSALALYRESLRECGASYGGTPEFSWPGDVRRAPSTRLAQFSRWTPIAAALLLLAVIPVYTVSRNQRREAELARADAALLEQVDLEISRAVPAPMEPLVKLVSWNDAANESKNSPGIKGETQ